MTDLAVHRLAPEPGLAYPTMSLTAQSDRLFFGECGHGIARYDLPRYPVLAKLNTRMQSFFWRPVEIDLSQERRDFGRLTDAEQHMFTANLRRQILLDSVQGRAPSLVLLPHCTDSALENCILTWSFFESIHSESYTHIIRAVYPDPSSVFDGIPSIQPIADCAVSVTRAYDSMVAHPSKENLYRALMAANALEAIRFYVSFACTFSFAQRGMMEGSAKVVRLIARDEGVHLALVQNILKLLPKDDPEFKAIAEDLKDESRQVFREAAEQEKAWAEYLFMHGGVLGLSVDSLVRLVDYLLRKRLHALGLGSGAPSRAEHPLPWLENWLQSDAVQVAPQEVEVPSYLVGTLVNDLESTNFSLD
jgi:ribonucleoside-diphosphate reductase beta chain